MTKEIYSLSDSPKDIIKLCYDKSFKTIFTTCPNVLAKMISDIIDIPYEDIVGKIIFSSNELLKDHIIIKNSICDYVITIDNLIINIEMNMNNNYWVKHRNFAYVANIYSNSVKVGEKSEMYASKKIYQINFNALSNKNDNIISEVVMFDKNSCKIYIDNFTIYNIDIVSAFNFVYNNINLLKDMSYKLRWAAILTADSLKDIEILLGDDLLPMEEKKKFISKIESVNKPLNLAEIWDYENEARMYKNQLISDGYDEGVEVGRNEGLAEGIEVGRNEGHAEGIEERNNSIIKTMLKLNYPKEEISKITGKSIEEIEEISLKK